MAARSIEEMVSKGQAKATAKDANIKASWAAAKDRCISNYAKMPFGPMRKANHAAAVRAATHRTDWPKWATNWAAKMRE